MQTMLRASSEPPVAEIDPLIADLVPGYMEARRKELDELRDCIRRCDLEKLRTIGHRLKGSGAGYGFPELTRLGARIEDAAADQDLGAVVEAVRELRVYLDGVRWVVRRG